MLRKWGILISAIAAATATASLSSDVPYSLQLHDSYVDPKLASDLLQGVGSEPLVSYEKHTIRRFGGNGTDEYLCRLSHAEHKKEAPPVVNRESDTKILAKAVSLIQSSFSRTSCVWAYDLSGSYWTYAFCNGDKIIQYHESASSEERANHKHIPSQPNSIFVLGRFSKASAKDVQFRNQASGAQYAAHLKEAERSSKLADQEPFPFAHTSEQKVVSQLVSDGSICDMTGQPRTIEIIYECAPKGSRYPAIFDVQEIKLCHYKMFMHVPQLCQYEPFVPNKKKHDSAVGTVCQKIDTNGENAGSHKSFEESLHSSLLRDHPNFPVRADNRVDVAGLNTVPMNRGFYVANFKDAIVSDNQYVKHRNIVLYNGFYDSLQTLNTKFAHTFYRVVGESLVAPLLAGPKPMLLDWKHSFVIWFEIYDYLGNFVGLSRIEHNSASDKGVLYAQMLHPETLLDSVGEGFDLPKFERPEFQAPNNMWNYEYFSETGEPRQKRPSKEDQRSSKARTFSVFNRGFLENSTVSMEVVDQHSNTVVPGFINGANQYEFEVSLNSNSRKTFVIDLLHEHQESIEFTLKEEELVEAKVNEKVVSYDDTDEIDETDETETNFDSEEEFFADAEFQDILSEDVGATQPSEMAAHGETEMGHGTIEAEPEQANTHIEDEL